jgi:hypothetical protein
MIAHQLSIFLENKPGRLEKVTAVLKDNGINIRAMTLATSTAGWGILNLIVDRPQEACRHLSETGHPAVLREIVVVRMADRPGALHDMLVLLANAGINVQNAYGTVLGDGQTAILIIDVEHTEHARQLFTAAGVATLTAEEVYCV